MKSETKLELLKLSVALVDVMQRTGEISGRKALPADKMELSETLKAQQHVFKHLMQLYSDDAA